MMKLISHNFWPKIICLMVAGAISIYVAQGEAKIANFPGTLSLNIRNTPSGLVVITDSDKVQIKISADRSLWNKLTADNFSAYVDLNNLNQGTHELLVNVTSNKSGVQIIKIDPDKILVRLEPITTKEVNISEKIEGQAGEGLVSSETKIEPQKTKISGPKSVIDKILEANVIIKLNGETSDLNKTLPIVALDADGEVVKNVFFDPQETKVTVPIVKSASTKTVGIKTKIAGKVKNGLWISQIQTTPQDLTISGSSGLLKAVNYIETNEINVDGLDKNKTYQIGLNYPSGVSSVDRIEKILVDVVLEPIMNQKEITASFNFIGIANNLQVSSFNPNIIKVLVTGEINILDNLNSADVKVNLNLSSYKSAGTYNIDITNDLIVSPNGVGISSVVPSSISVILTNK